jgi:hypothetical protein
MARLTAEMLGATPRQIDRELRSFSRAAKVLSSNRPRLIQTHPKKWIGVYKGKVRVTAKSFSGLMTELKNHGLRPNDTIIRYTDTSGRLMIF